MTMISFGCGCSQMGLPAQAQEVQDHDDCTAARRLRKLWCWRLGLTAVVCTTPGPDAEVAGMHSSSYSQPGGRT